MKKIIYLYSSLFLVLLSVMGVTYAAFVDKASIVASTFSVGSADIRLLLDLSLPPANNIHDDIQGPVFLGVSPNWSEDYLVKVYNNSGSPLTLTSQANYDTANDPDDLRQDIYVEPILWDDLNSDGLATTDELGTSLGRKTIVKWKTEGFDFGQMQADETKGVLLRLSTDSIPASKEGGTAVFDFEFMSTGAQ